jgi:iron(III) transport system ATP-binding protein
VESVSGDTAALALGDLRLTTPAHGVEPGERDVVIRPEAITVGGAGQGLAGEVLKSTYMGAHTEYTVRTAVGDLFAIGHDRLKRRMPGEAVGLTFAPDGVILVRP